MEEQWKDIENYEGLYQVSNLGRVRSLDRLVRNYNRWHIEHTKLIKGVVLKQSTDKYGYKRVYLSKYGCEKFVLVSRLVAKAFIPNPQNLPEVNHKSEVKTDNCVENLEWCDGEYNRNYGTRAIRAAKKRRKPVIQSTLDGVQIMCWFSVTDASNNTNTAITGISHCLKGKRNKAGGFKWKYAS